MCPTVVDSMEREFFCREGTKEEEHGLGLDKTEENPSAYCIVTL